MKVNHINYGINRGTFVSEMGIIIDKLYWNNKGKQAGHGTWDNGHSSLTEVEDFIRNI